jgi:hypothetical protein
MRVTISITVLAGHFGSTTVWFTLLFTSRHNNYSIDTRFAFPLYWFAVSKLFSPTNAPLIKHIKF